ncbi:Bodo-specific multi-copy gene family, putative [Bodo saltans]|uniref:Bodo-specific multi-copy gene family, putative n=1 Tax=Bodo saltans TaxID=75058 RepID=A0A0S4JQS9_BODSA|nr:Bodo-specific multi-copy gene family, putative [Bodo saltans]|eukprot:CUG92570.1 Bodo-specific multi-copy gene family, putative [Bodo saltans]
MSFRWLQKKLAVSSSPIPTASSADQFREFRRVPTIEGTPVGWLCRQGIFASAHRVKQIVARFSWQTRAVKYYNAATWAAHRSRSNIAFLLRSNHSHPLTDPDYDSLATLLQNTNDIASRNTLNIFRKYVEPPPFDASDNNLTNPSDSDIKSRELSTQLDQAVRALTSKPGSEIRNVAFLSTPEGSGGNMWLHFKEALKYGRVIVRCCDKSAQDRTSQWLKLVMADRLSLSSTEAPAMDSHLTDAGLCELIRMHVVSITGYPQDPSHYCDPQTAYSTWMSDGGHPTEQWNSERSSTKS